MRLTATLLAFLLAATFELPHGTVAGAAVEHESRSQSDENETAETEDVGARAELYLLQHGALSEGGQLARLDRARQEYERRTIEKRGIQPKQAAQAAWVSLGPTNGAGRMTSIAPHPTAIGTVYAGAAGGGLWKTADGGATWEPLTDDLPDLAVGAVAVAPSAPDTIYLGTGEPTGMPGIGLLTSSDGGATWRLPAAVIANSFYRLSVHPEDPRDVVAATDSGGLRSTDGGATWTPFLQGTAVTDLVRSAADPAVLYAATGASQVWMSQDSGATWTSRSAGLPSTPVRLSLAMSPSNPQRLFAAAEISGTAHVYRTTDGGLTWQDLDAVRNDPDIRRFMGTLGSWANAIVVLPGNPEVVVAGGVGAIRSADGGATWTAFPATHADFHDLRSQGLTLWIANDGGVWTSADGGLTAVDRNAGLVTRQYYALANDPSRPERVLAGAQDNGTSERPDEGGSAWRSLGGGDSFDCAVNPIATDTVYTSGQFGGINRIVDSVDGSAVPQPITPPYDADEQAPFRTVLALDPTQPATLYTGSARVWRSTDAGDSWEPLPTATVGANWNAYAVATIAVAPSSPAVLMVGKGPNVYRTADGGQTWNRGDDGLPGAPVNRIAIDPTDASIAYAAVGAADSFGVYATTDGGAHWQPRSAGLPSAAALVVRVAPNDPAVLYCGTEVGVFRSNDRGATWSRLGAGLPATSVQDLQVRADGSVVRIATYGRGVWELAQAPQGEPAGRGAPALPCPMTSDCPSPAPRPVPSRP